MPFHVTMMLADAAQAIDNKLFILGGGWSVTGPQPSPSALALHIKVPWDRSNERHTLLLELVDLDGDPVLIETPVGPQSLRIENKFEVGRPPGIKPGSSLDMALAVGIGPLPLTPGGTYVWRLSINGESHADWTRPFAVRDAPQAPTAPR